MRQAVSIPYVDLQEHSLVRGRSCIMALKTWQIGFILPFLPKANTMKMQKSMEAL
jgi:hypothetical protein